MATFQFASRVTACAAILAVAACGPSKPRDAEPENTSADTPALPRLPIVEPPFDRTRLLSSIARAASAHAAGENDADSQRKLDGKQFEVRLRFGCDGQGPGLGSHGWSLDPDGRNLRFRVVPTLSDKDELVASLAGDAFEAVEGFWISRPWLLSASCPREVAPVGTGQAADEAQSAKENAAPSAAAGSAQVGQRIGIGRFFTPEDSRTGRRMARPFDAVVPVNAGEAASRQGFNLVLSGRLRALVDGRVIMCSGSGRDRPPDCIVSADMDRVRIERPEDGRILAEWTI